MKSRFPLTNTPKKADSDRMRYMTSKISKGKVFYILGSLKSEFFTGMTINGTDSLLGGVEVILER